MPKNPYRKTPIVLEGQLTDYSQMEQTGEAQKLAVGSAQWFAWLETAPRFAYRVKVSTPTEGLITLTVRRESKQRGSQYWVAYSKDRSGKLHKVYAGKSDTITWERLNTVGQRLLEKLGLSYPTPKVNQTEASLVVEPQSRQPRRKRPKQPQYPPLTRKEMESFHVFTKMLDFCSIEFEKRWGRPWRWAGGKITRNYFDKNYYVWAKEGSEHAFLGEQRYFIIQRLLHWVNHGYDQGYDSKLHNI
jgi:hypothetical protein